MAKASLVNMLKKIKKPANQGGLFVLSGVPGGIRTPDLRIRSPLLYPAEPQGHKNGAGSGNRTRATSLEGWGSTIELHPPAKNIIQLLYMHFKDNLMWNTWGDSGNLGQIEGWQMMETFWVRL